MVIPVCARVSRENLRAVVRVWEAEYVEPIHRSASFSYINTQRREDESCAHRNKTDGFSGLTSRIARR